MLVSLLIYFLTAVHSKSLLASSINHITVNETSTPNHIISPIDFINYLLRSIQQTLNITLNVIETFDHPTSEPPDFMANYNMDYIPNPTTPKFTSPAINWYYSSTNLPTDQPNLFTNYYLSTPKLPSRPYYTFMKRPTTKLRPTDFWDQLYGAGINVSEGNTTTGVEIAREFKTICVYNCGNRDINIARKIKTTQKYSRNIQFKKQKSHTPSIRSSKRPIYIRSTANNYERDWEIHATKLQPHRFKWSWGGMQAVFEAS